MTKKITKVAVLGNGVMGRQIAAHCANARVETFLFGLGVKATDTDSAEYALNQLLSMKPSPLATPDLMRYITPANYTNDCKLLNACDLVIEAVSEDVSIKQNLYQQIAEHLNENVIVGSNTSGLSIENLTSYLPEALRNRFCGVHFFNPPRYLPLVELIPSTQTSRNVLNTLEEWMTTILGKHIVIAKDTPGFVANRIGVFASLSALRYGEHYGLRLDTIDELTGILLKRSKTATCRTIDLVGLDIFAGVTQHLHNNLQDDPWREYFVPPQWMMKMIKQGQLGQKTGIGLYRKSSDKIEVFNIVSGDYQLRKKNIDSDIKSIFEKEDSQIIDSLSSSTHPQAQFLYNVICDLMHYVAYHVKDIASSTRDIDFALRWGYGWKKGVFEQWQQLGWQKVLKNIELRMNEQSHIQADLPAWVCDQSRRGVFTNEGAWSPKENKYIPQKHDGIYQHQLYAPTLEGEFFPQRKVISESENSIIWGYDEIVVISFKTKLHSLSYQLIVELNQAIELAETQYKGLIIWHQQPPFCAGANLFEILLAAKVGKTDKSSIASWMKEASLRFIKPQWPDISGMPSINEVINYLQKTFMRLRNCQVPTIATVDGLALGGGCEMLLHCDRVVASLESYIGLVEIGVGVLPAGGGCKEMASRASDDAKGGDIFPHIIRYYEQIAKGSVSSSALHAKTMGYLRDEDTIVMNSYEILHVAKQQLLALHDSGYRPPFPKQRLRIAGATAAANLNAQLVNLREGSYISEYDYYIASKISDVMCGVPLACGEEADAQWYLDQERKAFVDLLKEKKTQDRIEHMLKKGKPLRN